MRLLASPLRNLLAGVAYLLGCTGMIFVTGALMGRPGRARAVERLFGVVQP
jgi:hypothetical protein